MNQQKNLVIFHVAIGVVWSLFFSAGLWGMRVEKNHSLSDLPALASQSTKPEQMFADSYPYLYAAIDFNSLIIQPWAVKLDGEYEEVTRLILDAIIPKVGRLKVYSPHKVKKIKETLLQELNEAHKFLIAQKDKLSTEVYEELDKNLKKAHQLYDAFFKEQDELKQKKEPVRDSTPQLAPPENQSVQQTSRPRRTTIYNK